MAFNAVQSTSKASNTAMALVPSPKQVEKANRNRNKGGGWENRNWVEKDWVDVCDLFELRNKYICRVCLHLPEDGKRRCTSKLCKPFDGIPHYFCETYCLEKYRTAYDCKNGIYGCGTDPLCEDFDERHINFEEYPAELKKAFADNRKRERGLSLEERNRTKDGNDQNIFTEEDVEMEMLEADKQEKAAELAEKKEFIEELKQEKEYNRKYTKFLISDSQHAERKAAKLKGRLICGSCGEGPFSTYVKLNSHRMQHHQKEQYAIYSCDKVKDGVTCQFRHADFSQVLQHREGRKCPISHGQEKLKKLTCQRCDRVWSHMGNKRRHEKTCRGIQFITKTVSNAKTC